MGNDQIVASGWIPLQSIGVMQANALTSLPPGPANAAVENPQHGIAGVDDIRGEGGMGGQQARQKAPIPVSQQQCMARAGQMDQLRATAAR